MGMRMDAIKYSDWARQVFTEAISHRRALLVLPKDAEKGYRFSHDAGVLWRLESSYTEEQFLCCPGIAIDAALLDAAQSDWWYNHEVRYDDEEYGGERNDDEE